MLHLSWSKNFRISQISRTAAVTANPGAVLPTPASAEKLTTGTIFQINCTKIYVPVVTSFCESRILKNTPLENKYRPYI